MSTEHVFDNILTSVTQRSFTRMQTPPSRAFPVRRETGHFCRWLVRGAARLNQEWWRPVMSL